MVERTPITMKPVTLLLALAAFQASAQTDTLRTGSATPGSQQSIWLGFAPGKGAGVHIDDGDDVPDQDTIRIELKRKVLTILVTPRDSMLVGDTLQQHIDDLARERRNTFTYWAGLDLGLNNWVGPDGSGDLDADAEFMQLDAARSRFFAINFMEQKVEFGSHRAGLLTGLGLEWTSYHLMNNVHLTYDKDSVYGMDVNEPQYSKNKLRQMGLRVPLMVEFNTKRAPLPTTAAEVRALEAAGGYSRKGNFHIALGVVGTWYFETMYKQKYAQYGDRQKDRSNRDYHLLPYRAAATVRLGWGGWNLFGEYALTDLFANGKGPSLTPFNVGLTLVGFN